jgi:nicotinamide-nucleotide amidase
MKKASIVSIGNELLTGQTVNTNASYLSERLLSISIPVVNSYTIGDDIDSIVRAFNLAAGDADIILATGGLGPTDDDLTRQAMAKFLNKELQFHKELWLGHLGRVFTGWKPVPPENNKVQAYIPAGAKAIENNLGTAPGIRAESNGKLFFAMPGVPSEMKQMFEESILPELKNLSTGQAVVIRKLKCFGVSESAIADLVERASSPLKHTAKMAVPLMQRGRNPLVNCTVDFGVITLTIIATAKDKGKASQMAEKDEKSLRDKLGELIYGTGEQTLAEVVGEQLARQKKTLAVAESCTGGLLAKLITDISGASGYFTHGWITYSNPAKTTELGVPSDLIEKYGAVSEQVAEAMAQGARKKAATDFAIAITGIAGPDGATKEKPVGLVYISVDSDNGCDTQCYLFSGGRDSIRLRAAQTALNMLRLKLNI